MVKKKKLPPGYYDPKDYTLVHNRLLSELQRAAATAPLSAYCQWTFDGDWEFGESWDTACGNKWQFSNDGDPKENEMAFCCFCGSILEQVGAPEAADAVDPQDDSTPV